MTLPGESDFDVRPGTAAELAPGVKLLLGDAVVMVTAAARRASRAADMADDIVIDTDRDGVIKRRYTYGADDHVWIVR